MEDFCSFKIASLRQKLLDPRSAEASKMQIRSQLENLEEKLLALVKQTIFHNDNTSVIIYGPKGSGKTLLAERVIRALEEEFNRRNKVPVLCTVRLSGSLERNQRDGFKSIVQQICKFTELEFQKQSSAQENILFLKTILRKLKDANRTCLLVLEDFEHFVRNSEKQEILYTLLDLLQSKDVRCCIVGFTSDAKIKMDFNKRVISRFSNKVWSISKIVDPHDTLLSMLSLPPSKNFKSESSKYQKSLKEALVHKELQEIFENESICFCASDLRDIALLSASYARDQACLSSADILQAMDECLKRFEIMVEKIAYLSVPQLYTLVSCYLLKSNFTYKTAFGKYNCFISMQNTSEIFGESLMIHAFEDLFHEGLIVHVKPLKLSLISPLDHFNLNVTKDEIWKGLNRNPLTSTVLRTFFKSQ